MIDINNMNEFKNILQNNKNKSIILYFGAKWCNPCLELKKKINNYKFNNTIILYIDADSDNDKLFEINNIKGLPTSIFCYIENKELIENDRQTGTDFIKFIINYEKLLRD